MCTSAILFVNYGQIIGGNKLNPKLEITYNTASDNIFTDEDTEKAKITFHKHTETVLRSFEMQIIFIFTTLNLINYLMFYILK